MILPNRSLTLICTIFYGLITLPTVTGECTETFNSELCQLDVFCGDYFELQNSYNNYYKNNYLYNDLVLQWSDCTDIEYIPVHLVYKQHTHIHFRPSQDREEEVPVTNRQIDIIRLIHSLDLTNNFYEESPTLRVMQNLAVLNLSKNLLTIAKLTNKRSLPALTAIDLSHNKITDVEVSREEYILRSLERINLSYNSLVRIPEAIFEYFSNLTSLDVSYNSISSLSPNTFEGIKNLIYLNMSNNQISDINSSLFRFKALRLLDLSNNLLYNISNKDFIELTALTNLNLEANYIKSINENTFMNLCNLNVLNLNDNKLELINEDAFISANKLKVILISKNKLNALPKSLFRGKSIETFSMIENNLNGSLVRGMFEGLTVSVLDLSNQNIATIDNNAFFGLGPLEVLLLQNNNISTLFPKCFYMLNNLKQLDLSYNKISIIEFDKQHLGNLEALSIRNNALTVIKHEFFENLDALQYLDLSDNKISWIESNSFGSLKNLISFEISNNPLNLTLEENTFEGLISLPSFDISCTLLTTIRNGSFNGMKELKILNMSHSHIHFLQYNTFLHTGYVEILDLSHNKIKEFVINNTQIDKLSILYLNNNLIKSLDFQTFGHMLDLTKIFLSYNEIEKINLLTFENQKDLQILDLSNNPELNFNISVINTNRELTALHISGIKAGMSFDKVGHVPLIDISIANASIANVQALQLNNLNHLEKLDLSKNKIIKVEVGYFANVSALRTLDLSFNKITYIQSGALRDNSMLTLLNVSHNCLASVSYGIFHGLINLKILDISYNDIDSIQNERFHELKSLSILIADHNKIEDFDDEMLKNKRFSTLSIGNNPIPCKRIVHFRNSQPPIYEITAITLDVNNDENVYGIICNNNKYSPSRVPNKRPVVDHKDIISLMINIRDILSKPGLNEHDTVQKMDEEYLANITNEITKLNELRNNSETLLIHLNNVTSQIASKNYTDILLEKILKVLTMNSLRRPTIPSPITKDNATYDNLVNYVDKLRQQLEETITFEKNNILIEVENKLNAVNSRVSTPVHENLRLGSHDSESTFTKTCVGLILTILICFILYKFYKSGMFMRRRFSVSERELPSSMDSPL